MLGLRLIENLILPFVKNPFDLLSMAHTCSGIRKYVRNMKYWKFDEFIEALRFLSGLDSHCDTDSFIYLIRFVLYPYRNTGFEYGGKKRLEIGDMVFPSISWVDFDCITNFMVILYDDWHYHNVGEDEYGIRTVSADLIMKRICLYYGGELVYDYDNSVQCNWSRMWITSDGSYTYTMMPDRICRKK